MQKPPSDVRPPKRRLLLSIYLVGVAQLAVAGIAIFATQMLLEKAPWQVLQVRQKAVLDGFAEFYDSPDALARSLSKLEDIDLSFYRLNGTLVATTEPPLEPLDADALGRLQKASMIFIPHRGPLPVTAVPVRRGGAMVGYGLVHYRPLGELSMPHGMRPPRENHLREPVAPSHDSLEPARADIPPPPPAEDGLEARDHRPAPAGLQPPHGPFPEHDGFAHPGLRGLRHEAFAPGGPGAFDGHGPPRGPPPARLWPAPSLLPIIIACALLGAAVISFLFARSLARPLARMAAAAQAFGSGDLTARAGVRRDDELGAVAQTFDLMAERVNGLLRAQREFLANVSHELRTPLARIRVALDIAAEGDMDSARQCLREIAQDWGDLDRLVEDVLTVARFDLGQDRAVAAMTLRYEAIDPDKLANRAAAAFRSVHARHTLELDAAGAPMLYGDGAMLRRVVDNLLNNAAKYSEPGTTIRLSIAQRDDHIEFTVADRGIGIDAADMPRLFEPFFRSDKSRARKTGGVGLGLALAKRIVEAHHGHIDVHSQIGVGTTVRFRVPIDPAPDSESAEAAS
jgi:signal transduction histidine kinase